MKFLKWLLIGLVTLVLLIGIGVAALVYLVDWNDFRETIQNQTRKHTGRDLVIAGDLSPSVFPWAGISVGDITLANAEGFGDQPFAKIGSADVKVELLPLLRKVVNVRTVELKGLNLNLQKAADGSTNWDDLVNQTTTTTTTTDDNTTTEVEGSTATIAALAVGGIEIADANVSWFDAQSGMDAKLSDFNLATGAIELGAPFDLSIDFSVASNSMDLAAIIKVGGEITIDLDNQNYSLDGFTLTTDAKGGSLPNGALVATLGADISAQLNDQTIEINNLALNALGIALGGAISVVDLDSEPKITGNLVSDEFSPLELFGKLGIEAPQTADASVLQSASLSLALSATPASAALNDLTIKLDDTTFSGSASVPSLAGAIPPLRFKFAVDAIDLDRYLPPVSEAAEGDVDNGNTSTTTSGNTSSDASAESNNDDTVAADATGDTPIELPLEMLRQLDVDGEFRVGSVKISNLTTDNIVVPVQAKNGRLTLDGLTATLYEGQFTSNVALDATKDTPDYSLDMQLNGIQADPLLADLLQDKSFLSGKGDFAAAITTTGDSVNALKQGLNGGFNTAFNDGSINGINIGYQIRRAKAALTGKKLEPEDANVKTDFSSLSVSGVFSDGVMSSDDLDMRSPLLRLSGAGLVDLPGEQVDYTLTTLITGTSQGQGGKDLGSLKGVKLDIPIRGSFDELAANFTGVVLKGMKDNIAGNLKGQAQALADQEAAKLKAKAKEEADKLKAQAAEQLQANEAEAKQKLDEATAKAKDKIKGKLKGLLK